MCDGYDTDCGDGGGATSVEDADGDGFYTDDPTVCVGGLDCADADAAVSPAHTTYSSRQHCSGTGAIVCTGSSMCCPSTTLCLHPDATCFEGSFDWNCDYEEEPRPARETVCSDDSCTARFEPVVSDSAFCGTPVEWQRCRDWGGTVGCLPYSQDMILPCR